MKIVKVFLKATSILISMIFLTTVLASNVVYSPDIQAFATIEDSNSEISDSIKKSCPTYEGNGNINSLVSDVLKACLNKDGGGVSEPTPRPMPQNVALIDIDLPGVDDELRFKISAYGGLATDSWIFVESAIDAYTLPVGTEYTIEITDHEGLEFNVDFNGVDCKGGNTNTNTCTQTFSTTVQHARISPVQTPN
ncbi:hypothetical protein [Candidatus Nitrosocosmicus hydrocola]|uniref:hypothetical protein n=1 Tax=Candidatus Nitrosocosmicus hydrocola TaxID=1826872 RepID=UPI0011E5F86B|nr:hypothetical protein [Candidatus Nitrosocosmicus hydrocola]